MSFTPPFRAAFLSAVLLTAASAGPLLEIPFGGAALTSTDPTITGRPARDGLPSDWSWSKLFPGTFGLPGQYAYDQYLFGNPYAFDLYYQVILDDWNDTRLLFATSYLNSFNPFNLEQDYLGDAGSSPLIFGLPVFYQVIVPGGADMVVVVNAASPGTAGLPLPYGLIVEAFQDPYYTPLGGAGTVPEPSTIGLTLLGAALLAIRRLGVSSAKR